jgi:hypothetical protein
VENSNQKLTNEINEIINISPATIWDELAEADLLVELIRKFKNKEDTVSAEMLKYLYASLYSYSTEIEPEVEEYFTKKYMKSIQFFLDKTEHFRNREV